LSLTDIFLDAIIIKKVGIVMQINKRIQYFRKKIKKLTQAEFSKQIHMSRSNLASIEVGSINVTDRVIANICDTFAINEHWLRSGEGEITRSSTTDIFKQLRNEFHLNKREQEILSVYLKFDEAQRNMVLDFITTFSIQLVAMQQKPQ